jgi:hypothetical protein
MAGLLSLFAMTHRVYHPHRSKEERTMLYLLLLQLHRCPVGCRRRDGGLDLVCVAQGLRAMSVL